MRNIEHLSEKVGGPYRTRTYNQLIKSQNNDLRSSALNGKGLSLIYMLRTMAMEGLFLGHSTPFEPSISQHREAVMKAAQWADQAKKIDAMRDAIATNRVLWKPEFKDEFNQATAKLEDLSNLVWRKAIAAERKEEA